MTAEGLEHLAQLCREAAAYAETTGEAVLGAGLRLGSIAAGRMARQERAQLPSPSAGTAPTAAMPVRPAVACAE